jgi:hypothetical protein
MNRFKKFLLAFTFLLPIGMYAQKGIQFNRPADQHGVNVFETTKADTVEYSGLKLKIGGNFTQQFQSISHSNTADENNFPFGAGTVDLNKLYPLGPGFNLATANLNFDIQLEDGIRVKLENYMSSRHHPEFWVKGGYIQVDKLPMFGSPQWFTDHVTVKFGHFGINYGDQQFRRSDNGNTFYNPFVGNYIMDAFATEIGGEIYVWPVKNLFVMFGMTNGLINGDVKDYGTIEKNPSILGKLGYDSQISEDLRFRLSASFYTNSGTTRNTLYAGDRAGSRYYFVMEPEYYRNFRAGGAVTASSADNRFTSARISPDFTSNVTAISVNPFVKFKGLELFGTYEMSKGRNATEFGNDDENREFSQLAGELIYRFLEREQLFIAGRYNKVSGRLAGYTEDVSVDRTQIALGWYTTPNMMVKLEYVTQNYNDFVSTDYRSGGKFSGFMLEAAIAF